VRSHLTLVRIEIVKNSANNKYWRGVEKREPSYTVPGRVSWCHSGGVGEKQIGSFAAVEFFAYFENLALVSHIISKSFSPSH